MAEIKTLKQGETQVLPRTVAEAVNTDSGLSVQAELDALKESTPDVSAQINEHNVAEDAHANRFANYLPLSGGIMTGPIAYKSQGDSEALAITYDDVEIMRFISGGGDKNVEFNLVRGNFEINDCYNLYIASIDGNITLGKLGLYESGISFSDTDSGDKYALIKGLDTEKVNSGTEDYAATKGYVDDQIAAIPTPDVSAQIEAHNTSTAAHANMHWLTADDEMLSSITPDGSIDADTLEGHPASYFATKTDLENVNVDLSNYYTKAEVDAKITQIQQLIDEAAALVDQINGEVI